MVLVRFGEWEAILAMDATKLGKSLSDTLAAWGAMLPYTTDPYLRKDAQKSAQLRRFVAQYDRPHTKGCLFSGAGGGFLLVVSETPVEGAMQMRLNHAPPCLPYRSATLEEAHAAPKASPPPEMPPWGVPSPWALDIDGRPFPPPQRAMSTKAILVAAAAALAAGVVIGKRMR